MRKMMSIAAAAAVLLAAPAAAVQFSVNVGAPVQIVPGNNNFITQLTGLGLTDYTTTGAMVTLTGFSNRLLKFEFLGSESGFNDSFSAAGGTINGSENTPFTAWNPVVLGSALYSPGQIADWLFSSSGGAVNKGIGTPEFAIFLPTGLVAGNTYTSKVLYLGFDDQIVGDDDNHDDFIVRVTAVPEPQTWAMLVAGFGLVGLARRRRTQVVAA